jgi:hypothetical protein
MMAGHNLRAQVAENLRTTTVVPNTTPSTEHVVACQRKVKSFNAPVVPPVVEPKYISKCREKAWSIYWEKVDKNTGEVKRYVKRFRCGSWRHTNSDCSRKRAQMDFARCREAIDRREDWIYMVLTVPRKGTMEDMYKSLVRKWQSLCQWAKRRYKEKFEYIMVVEEHKDGWPHANVLVYGENFVADVKSRGWRAVREDLNVAAERCGWGLRFYLSLVNSRDAALRYSLKLGIEKKAAEQLKDGQIVSEVVKLTQAPVHSPRGFRRLRTSKGLLPPIKKPDDENFEIKNGCLLTTQVENVCGAFEAAGIQHEEPKKYNLYEQLWYSFHWFDTWFRYRLNQSVENSLEWLFSRWRPQRRDFQSRKSRSNTS